MLKDGVYILESVEDMGNSLMLIRFKDTEEEAYMYGDYIDTISMLKKEVICEFREELFHCKFKSFINNFTIKTIISTLDKEENIKLYTDNIPDTEATITFADMNEEEIYFNTIVYCSGVKFKSNMNTNWAELTIIDKKHMIGKLRVFDPETKNKDLAGHYVCCDLKKNMYGFNTQSVYIVEGMNMYVNSHVLICRKYLEQVLCDDVELYNFLLKSKMLNKIQNYVVDDTYEIGYLIVRLAWEVYIAKTLTNITNGINIQTLIRNLVLEKAYCLTRTEDSSYSKNLESILNISDFNTKDKEYLLNMLDESSQIEYAETSIAKSIKNICNNVLKAERLDSYRKFKKRCPVF